MNIFDKKNAKLKSKSIEAYPRWNFEKKVDIQDIIAKYQKYNRDELLSLQQETKIIVGRLIQKRIQGKTIFLNIKDFTNKIQIYTNKNIMSDLDFSIIEDANIGDYLLFSGTVMKTRTETLTFKATSCIHLVKSIYEIPEQFHGVHNKEIIYRKRYLDLLSNDNSLNIAKIRMNILKWIRDFFDKQNYYEAETPILQSIYGGAAAKPFTTFHNSLNQKFYLRIATEIALKKLLVGGFEKVYEMGRLFRNEGISRKHNPEFTSLEAYCAYENLDYMKLLIKNMIIFLMTKLNIGPIINYDEQEINFGEEEWKSHSMVSLIYKYTNIDFKKISNYEEAFLLAKKHNIAITKYQNSIGLIINKFFEQFVEQKLIHPTFVTDYPIEISPFAREIDNNPGFTERFELFIGGREYANAFTELNDPQEQINRFKLQEEQIKLGNEEANSYDSDFIEALSYGMPPSAGIGIGIDRLVMLLTNSNSIKDIILFPTLKKKNEYKKN